MFQTSSKYFPADAKVLGSMPWVGRISFTDLKEKVKELTTRPILCSKCSAALTNPALIQQDPKKGKYFLCEFCGTMNVIPEDLMPGTDLSEFVLGRLAGQTKPITEDTLLAIIDISGSMSGAKLAAVKESLIRTVTDLGVNAPQTAFSLIAFSTEVYAYDEKMEKILTLSGDVRYSVDQIGKAAEQALNKLKFRSLKDTRKQWIDNIEKLGSLDMTALGPAMVAGYVIMKGRGGRIILLTDGLANEGVGALEGASTTGAKLYEDLAAQASNAGIIIDVVGIKDPAAFMALEALAVMPMQTGGTMYYAETAELAAAMESASREKVVARNVRLRVIAPTNVEVTEVSGLGTPQPNQMQQGIRMGSVSADREVYVRLAPKAKVKAAEVPIQVQVTYMDDEGNQRMRVTTQRVKVTQDAKPLIETLDAELPATFAVQRAGEEQYRGDMAKSRTILEHTQRAIHDIRAQAPAKQSKAFERVEKVLQAQIAETEAAAARAKEEAKRRPAGPLRAAQVAAVADEDAAQSVQKAKLSRRKLFKSDSE